MQSVFLFMDFRMMKVLEFFRCSEKWKGNFMANKANNLAHTHFSKLICVRELRNHCKKNVRGV